jgi:hypothetical protein
LVRSGLEARRRHEGLDRKTVVNDQWSGVSKNKGKARG